MVRLEVSRRPRPTVSGRAAHREAARGRLRRLARRDRRRHPLAQVRRIRFRHGPPPTAPMWDRLSRPTRKTLWWPELEICLQLRGGAGLDADEAPRQLAEVGREPRAGAPLAQDRRPARASTPWTWNTDFAVSRPIAVASPMLASLRLSRAVWPGREGSRPQHRKRIFLDGLAYPTARHVDGAPEWQGEEPAAPAFPRATPARTGA